MPFFLGKDFVADTNYESPRLKSWKSATWFVSRTLMICVGVIEFGLYSVCRPQLPVLLVLCYVYTSLFACEHVWTE